MNFNSKEVKVKILSDQDKKVWDSFVDKSLFGSFYQKWWWGELQQKLKKRVLRIAVIDKYKLVLACQLILDYDPVFGKYGKSYHSFVCQTKIDFEKYSPYIINYLCNQTKSYNLMGVDFSLITKIDLIKNSNSLSISKEEKEDNLDTDFFRDSYLGYLLINNGLNIEIEDNIKNINNFGVINLDKPPVNILNKFSKLARKTIKTNKVFNFYKEKDFSNLNTDEWNILLNLQLNFFDVKTLKNIFSLEKSLLETNLKLVFFQYITTSPVFFIIYRTEKITFLIDYCISDNSKIWLITFYSLLIKSQKYTNFLLCNNNFLQLSKFYFDWVLYTNYDLYLTLSPLKKGFLDLGKLIEKKNLQLYKKNIILVIDRIYLFSKNKIILFKKYLQKINKLINKN